MGIQGLPQFLEVKCPKCIKERSLGYYSGHKIAIDTSIFVYQFVKANFKLATKKGKKTGHLLGMFQRTAKFIEEHIKPIYVFDGRPPDLKMTHAIADRTLKRKQISDDLEDASSDNPVGRVTRVKKRTKTPYAHVLGVHMKEIPSTWEQTDWDQPDWELPDSDSDSDDEYIQEMRIQLYKPTDQQYAECKKLFELLGVPIVEAPSEAEAQCAKLCKDGMASAVASQDFDCLPFGVPLMIRNFKCPGRKNKPILEYNTEAILNSLGLKKEEFIDLCILSGCDYCDHIEGMEAEMAFDLIHKNKCIENVLNTERGRIKIPIGWNYKEARKLFNQPDVINVAHKPLWTAVNEEELIKFLVHENEFNEKSVKKTIEKINKARKAIPQAKMTRFFCRQ